MSQYATQRQSQPQYNPNNLSPEPTSPPREGRPSIQSRASHHRSWSFRSDRSSESKSSKPKVDLHETSKDKRRLSNTTKVNPNFALAEAQAFDQAQQYTGDGRNLSGQSYKDTQGNAITDPDTSNPTRHRLERPLDTIRSFEANIEAGYKRRSMQNQNESGNSILGNSGPRSNFMGNTGGYSKEFRERPDRQYYNNGRPSHYRMTSAQFASRNPMPEDDVYPTHSYQDSYDTVGGYSSGSASEPWGNSTDPSSENSSVDRIQPPVGGRYSEYTNDAYGNAYARQSPVKDAYGYSGQHDAYQQAPGMRAAPTNPQPQMTDIAGAPPQNDGYYQPPSMRAANPQHSQMSDIAMAPAPPSAQARPDPNSQRQPIQLGSAQVPPPFTQKGPYPTQQRNPLAPQYQPAQNQSRMGQPQRPQPQRGPSSGQRLAKRQSNPRPQPASPEAKKKSFFSRLRGK